MSRRYWLAAAGLSGLALAFAFGMAVGQQTPPTANKGVAVSPPTAIDLTQELDGVAGRQLRLRIVTIEPGGVVGVHSHNGRPAVAYVIQGTLTEYREGKSGAFEHHEGESWTEGKDVTHWAENKGDQPAVVIAVDVFKP